MRPIRSLLRALLLCAATAAGLAAPLTVRDDRGVEQRFEQRPQRIISLLPSLTETVWALGGGPRLVGVDRYSNWPAAIDKLPHLGGLDDTQIEAVIALKPDLVLASTSARSLDRLETLGVKVLRLKSESHADTRRTLIMLADLLGDPAAATRVWSGIEADLQAAAQRVPAGLRGRKVYFEIGGGPYAAGQQSFIGETLQRLGLPNIVPPELGPFPKLNPEYVLRAKPEIVMGVARELQGMPARPGWSAMPAIQAKRLCGFNNADYEMLIRPGPRLGEAARKIVDCLQTLK